MKKLCFLGEGISPAFYVVGALQTGFEVVRVFGNERFADRGDVSAALGAIDVFVLSDYPASGMTDDDQARILRRVEAGAGLLMIGGWSSFGGPRGSWRGTRLAEALPVTIESDDDRHNTPLGTVLVAVVPNHPATAAIHGRPPCVVCGFNRVGRRDGATVLIEGYALSVAAGGEPVPSLARVDTPILSVWNRGHGRVAALAPDVSPHWAGGIIDWGMTRRMLPTGAEVSDLYPAFLNGLCGWLATG
ncbi:MAG: hypothetical protein EPO26_10230 [Chloroflexota bacterium]|nr:MAG: hypothetical protein EPO26_10230 [Chloroflexota bacterium]